VLIAKGKDTSLDRLSSGDFLRLAKSVERFTSEAEAIVRRQHSGGPALDQEEKGKKLKPALHLLAQSVKSRPAPLLQSSSVFCFWKFNFSFRTSFDARICRSPCKSGLGNIFAIMGHMNYCGISLAGRKISSSNFALLFVRITRRVTYVRRCERC